MPNLHHVIGRPWAVTAELAELGRQLIEADGTAALRLGVTIHSQVADPVAAAGQPRKEGGSLALIPILGLMTHRGGSVNSMETASAMAIEAAVRAAAADKSVSAILLEIDSPGGEVSGIPELAAVIREARATKPVVAFANSDAGSAAYWIASQADELVVTPSGRVGSVGVYVAHVDRSGEMAAAGRKVTYISAGKFKVEGNPHEPLTDEGRSAVQAEVNRYYAMFTGDVAKGRGVGVETVRSGFGEGRMLGAKAAVDEGMATAVGTFGDAVRRAASLARDRGRGSAAAQAEATKLRRARG